MEGYIWKICSLYHQQRTISKVSFVLFFSNSGTREVHNKLEKNRRAHLKECFELLKSQVPAIQDEKKPSNLTILRTAIRYVQVSLSYSLSFLPQFSENTLIPSRITLAAPFPSASCCWVCSRRNHLSLPPSPHSLASWKLLVCWHARVRGNRGGKLLMGENTHKRIQRQKQTRARARVCVCICMCVCMRMSRFGFTLVVLRFLADNLDPDYFCRHWK